MKAKIQASLKKLFPYGTINKERDVFKILNGFYRLAVEFETGPVRVYYGPIVGVEIHELGGVIRFNVKIQNAFGKDGEFVACVDYDWTDGDCRVYYEKEKGISRTVKCFKFSVFSSDGKLI
ncbi:hypothetical protein HZB94_01455 [Candidatus Falkowbacteria bacterium]|nr:hypothetical protein [Candidatus Falkowbacteria bacterium]